MTNVPDVCHTRLACYVSFSLQATQNITKIMQHITTNNQILINHVIDYGPG